MKRTEEKKGTASEKLYDKNGLARYSNSVQNIDYM